MASLAEDDLGQLTPLGAQSARAFMEDLGLEYPLEYDDVRQVSDRRQLEHALVALEDEIARQKALYEEHKEVYQAVHTIEALQVSPELDSKRTVDHALSLCVCLRRCVWVWA